MISCTDDFKKLIQTQIFLKVQKLFIVARIMGNGYNWGNQGWEGFTVTIYLFGFLQETPITGLQQGTNTMMHMPL
jgi:hypothetical protein